MRDGTRSLPRAKRRWTASLARSAAVLARLLLAVVAVAGASSSASTLDDALLAEVLAPDAPTEGPEREALLRRLTGLGARAVPDVFELLASRELVRAGGEPPLPVDAADEALLIEALQAWPADRVAAGIVASARGGDLHERLLALHVLRETARAVSVAPLLEHLAGFSAVEAQQPLVRAAAADALAAMLRRDEDAYDELADRLSALEPAHDLRRVAGLRRALVDALGAARSGAALPLLRAMLGRDEDLDVAVLAAVGALPRWDEAVRDGEASWILTGHLHAASPKVRRQAVLALGALRDCETFEQVIGLLGDPDRRVRIAALTALRTMNGLRWPADAARWHVYLQQESAWYAAELSRVLTRLGSREAHEVVDALRRLPEHPLYHVELADEVAPLLASRNEAVAAAACAALARLDAAVAVAPLCDALADPRPPVSAGAWNALRAITGLDLPRDEPAWRAALAL